VPWLDVMGSIARATETDDDEAAKAVIDALSASKFGSGSLGVYLRLVAANWARRPGTGRVFIVVCSPDLRVDIALRSSAMPVEHVRIVHCPREPGRLFGERVVVVHGRADRQKIDAPADLLLPTDRVVLIKPFGCFDDPANVLLTAEQWRASSRDPMPLPDGIANVMTRSFLLVLGAGAFSPSLQILFSVLLRDALKRVDNNSNRYLVHRENARVPDPLHRVEAALANSTHPKHAQFDTWVRDTYGLFLKPLDALLLLAWLDHLLQ